jgi:hypothetical protein
VKNTILKTILFLLLFSIVGQVNAQFSFGIKVGGIAFHPKYKVDGSFYKWKINKIGNIAAFSSITFTAGYQVNDYMGIKVAQVIMFSDCAGKFAGISHLGVNLYDRIVGWHPEDHRISMSVGPLFYYRKNWHEIGAYVPTPGFMNNSKDYKWETKLVWYGGQIQYDYFVNDQNAISVNFLPGYPYIYALSAGWEYRDQNY